MSDAVSPVKLPLFSAADRLLMTGKSRVNRLAFAVLLAFRRALGRFPRPREAVEPALVAHVARQVGCDAPVDAAAVRGRTLKRYRAEIRARLDALVQSLGHSNDGAAAAETASEGQVDAPLIHLRATPGRASVASLREELARLDMVRGLVLPDDLFADWSPAELEACRQRVAVEAPYELRRHPEPTRLAWRGSRPTPTCAAASSPTRSLSS